MFNRKAYKKQASAQLEGRRLLTIFITVLNILILSLFSSEFKSKMHASPFSQLQEGNYISAPAASIFTASSDFSWNFEYSLPAVSPLNVSGPLDFLLNVLMLSVMGILLLARNTVYNEYFQNPGLVSINVYLAGFVHFVKGAFSMLWFTLWVTLWSLLFFIPGIVKSYSYRQMFFILAENPKISVTKAMNISKEITKGHKADLFILDLSFIGWFILSSFTLGILLIWVIPYYNMTCMNAYKDIKLQALKTGSVKPEDFN